MLVNLGLSQDRKRLDLSIFLWQWGCLEESNTNWILSCSSLQTGSLRSLKLKEMAPKSHQHTTHAAAHYPNLRNQIWIDLESLISLAINLTDRACGAFHLVHWLLLVHGMVKRVLGHYASLQVSKKHIIVRYCVSLLIDFSVGPERWFVAKYLDCQ